RLFRVFFFFFSSRRRHTRFSRDWSSDVCSSDLAAGNVGHGDLTAVGLDQAPDDREPESTTYGVLLAGAAGGAGGAGRAGGLAARSEERRVGKEGRCRWSPCHCKDNAGGRGGR